MPRWDQGRWARPFCRSAPPFGGAASGAGAGLLAAQLSQAGEGVVEPALREPGPAFYVLKIEPDRTGGRGEPYAHGRAMKEQFIDRLGKPDA